MAAKKTVKAAKKVCAKAACKKQAKVSKKGFVYHFGAGKADGNGAMKELLGGKGANLAEMAGHPKLKLPVPPGFTITTEVCTYYWNNKRTYPKTLKAEVETNLKKVEKETGKVFGSVNNPLLVSVRSGARSSMPGMMETILNVGLTLKTIPGMIKMTGDERFVYDAYRRLIMMYSDVVMEKAAGIEPKDDKGIRKILDEKLCDVKAAKGYKSDTELTAQELKALCEDFKKTVKKVLGSDFPDDPMQQLWGAIGAVFASWNGKRAVAYRNIEKIPHDWGTAVNVQSMVFGNMGNSSATGVAFTRNPGNGDSHFYGEYLVNAQGEDVVAGIRTPCPINEWSTSGHGNDSESLKKVMPKAYKELDAIQKRLEKHYKDMLDIEFTIENGRLWLLQCRVGKRNGIAAVQIALDMLKEKLINKVEAVLRVSPAQLDELLHPIVDPKAEASAKAIAKGLPAGPGGACGFIVFDSAAAIEAKKAGKECIIVREETNPEDVEGMRAAQAILTARGGMTSHAALVARGWGKCCIVGCSEITVDTAKRIMTVNGKQYKEGDYLTLNGTRGYVYEGKLSMLDAGEKNANLINFLKVCDAVKRLKVRANADTAADAEKAKAFGAQGIGLFRIEHMFYGANSEKPLFALRKMILSGSTEERVKALKEIFPFMKKDIKAALKAMAGFPVTIRLMDPPLHEFIPHSKDAVEAICKALKITPEQFEKRAEALKESNPMMGHRGIRLGVTYPEITEMQARAIFEAAAELIKEGLKITPEIMIPVVCDEKEIVNQKPIIEKVHKEVCAKAGKKIAYTVGTMIEIPRAAITSADIAQVADFYSFGTNDLTQMTFGFSRDDIGAFVPDYIKKGILKNDPFQILDQTGVGFLIRHAVKAGRGVKKNLKIGICGEHGGEPSSVEFCHREGFDYVSCSPFRVPIARLAAAQASAKEMKK
ncbi:pyruvate, phosphate dikinase [Candidatus Proelusimicrobium excrementi]|uniref:pyruvate, phosphate dikinase n=1 Tax=Candidatus Proelusimicrobium excrementi TaxID=3416222 RepID=UPI003C8D3816|nr:pyruvate, phosphate dikinase [Elusimicrobiaceae bacterium]